MTTKKELLAKIAELQAQVDAMPDELKIPTVRAYEALDGGDKYFLVDSECDVYSATWTWHEIDKVRLCNGQAFLTEEAAEREVKRRKLWHQCRKAMKDAWEAHGEMPDWTRDNQTKHCVSIYDGELRLSTYHVVYYRIHFPTKESREDWRATVTDDEIKLMLIEEW